MTNIKKLIEIQQKFSCKKSRKSADRRAFSYRSAEDILEAFRELVKAEQMSVGILLSDAIEEHGDSLFVCSTAMLHDEEGEIASTSSLAELDKHNGGMSLEQATGCAVSYARKYALGGLLAIDNSEADADAINRDKELEDAQRRAKAMAQTIQIVEVPDTEANVQASIKYCIDNNLTADEFIAQQAKAGKVICQAMAIKIKNSLVR